MITTANYREFEDIVWFMVNYLSPHYDKHICVAGSYGLVKGLDYLDKNMYPNPEHRPAFFSEMINSVSANDVDIWVPMVSKAVTVDPKSCKHGKSAMTIRREIIEEARSYDIDFHEELSRRTIRMLRAFNVQFSGKYYVNGFGGISDFERSQRHIPDPSDYGQWFYLTDGLAITITVKRMGTFEDVLKIQLITNNIVPIEHESWAEAVINQFDITSARVAFTGRNSVPVFGRDALHDILNGQFKFTMKPCVNFKRCLTRMMKYKHKGFILKKVDYDDQCSSEYKEYMNRRWQHMYINEIGENALMWLGLNPVLAQSICQEFLVPYFDIQPPFIEDMSFFKICDRLVENTYYTTRYFGASGTPIDITSYRHIVQDRNFHVAAKCIQRRFRMYVKTRSN